MGVNLMTDVIKRTGKKEHFQPEKIKNSIGKAIKDAGFNPQQKIDVIEHASRDAIQMAQNTNKVETKQIRDVILNNLEQDNRQIADTWRQYEYQHKKQVISH